MNRNKAARLIQKRYMLTRAPLRLPRNTVNEVTAGALGRIVVQAWNRPGGNVYYLNPETLKHFLNRYGRYTSPRTRAPAHYRYRRAVYVGSARKTNNMKNVMNKARAISRTISNQKSKRSNIMRNNNNRLGTTNWNALAWSPGSPSLSPISRRSSVGSNSNNNRHNAALLAQLRHAASTSGGTRRRLFE
jgi:hypothetical protein